MASSEGAQEGSEVTYTSLTERDTTLSIDANLGRIAASPLAAMLPKTIFADLLVKLEKEWKEGDRKAKKAESLKDVKAAAEALLTSLRKHGVTRACTVQISEAGRPFSIKRGADKGMTREFRFSFPGSRGRKRRLTAEEKLKAKGIALK